MAAGAGCPNRAPASRRTAQSALTATVCSRVRKVRRGQVAHHGPYLGDSESELGRNFMMRTDGCVKYLGQAHLAAFFEVHDQAIPLASEDGAACAVEVRLACEALQLYAVAFGCNHLQHLVLQIDNYAHDCCIKRYQRYRASRTKMLVPFMPCIPQFLQPLEVHANGSPESGFSPSPLCTATADFRSYN